MKKLNVKLLCILFSVVAVLCGTGATVYYIQNNRAADVKMIAEAEALRESGDLEEAIRIRRRYIRRNRSDRSQLAPLAMDMVARIEQVQEEGNMIAPRDFQETASVFEEAMRESEDDVQLRERAAGFLLRFGRYKDAIAHYTFLIQQSTETNPQHVVDLAICYLRSAQDDRAVEQLSRLVGYDPVSETLDASKAEMPESIDSYALLAQVYGQRRRQRDVAKTIIDQMVAVNQDSFDAYLKRAAYYAELEGKESTVRAEDIERAQELAPDEPDVLFSSAQLAIENEEFQKARELLLKTKEMFPDELKVYRGLATLATQENNVEEALEHIAAGLKIEQENIDLLWMRVNLQMQAGDFESVENSIEELRGLSVTKAFVRFLEGLLALNKQEWIKAKNLLEEVRPNIARLQTGLSVALDKGLARCYSNLGQPDMSAKAYARVVETMPDDYGAAILEIDALIKSGRTGVALKKYDLLDRKLSEPAELPRLLLTRLRLETLKQMELEEEGRIWTYAERIGKAIVDADTTIIDQSRKDSAIATLMRNTGRDEIAERIEDRVRKRDPENVAWKLSEIQELSNEDPEAALAKLEAVVAEVGDKPAIRLLKAEILIKLDPEDIEQQLAAMTEDVAELSERDQIFLLRYMGGVYLRRGEIPKAYDMWDRAAAQMPNDIRILLGLFQVAQQLGDDDKMLNAIARLEKRAGIESAESKWCRATYTIWRVKNQLEEVASLKSARGLLEEAKSQRPDWNVIYQMEAELSALKGDRESAIMSLEKALQIGGKAPSIMRELIRLYFEVRQYSRAKQMLAKLDPAQWTLMENRIDLEIRSQRGELPEDIEFDLTSMDTNDLRWKGKLFANAKRFEDAEACLERCIELAPESIQDWDALIRIYAVQDKRDEAVEAIREAQLVVPEDIAPIFLGQAYEVIRDYAEADRQYKSALDVNPDNMAALRALARLYSQIGRSDIARPYLDRIIQSSDGDTANEHPNIPWARRLLANTVSSSNTYQDYTEALQLIEANQQEGRPMATDDLLLWATLSTKRPDSLSRMRALELLEATAEQRTLSDSEKLALATLYNLQNRWPECQTIMNDLLAKNRNNMQLLEPWMKWLLEHDQLKQAQRWLDNCDPNSITSIRTNAHLLVRQGRPDKAKDLISRLIQKVVKKEHHDILRLAAGLTTEISEYDEQFLGISENIWREYVSREPRNKWMLASFLSRLDDTEKIKEAFDICEALIKAGNVKQTLQIAVAALKHHKGTIPNTSVLYERVTEWFDRALREMPDSQALMIQRSEFEDVADNVEGMEHWLREYLKSPNLNPQQKALVSNNLAYILALKDEGDEAWEHMEFAVSILGETADIKDTRAIVYLARNDSISALRDIDESIADGGESSLKLFHKAMAEWKANEPVRAQDSLSQAEALGLERKQLSVQEREEYDMLVAALRSRGFGDGPDNTKF